MKTITLNTAAVNNAGEFVDAGSDVGVGSGKTQIDADRAKDLVGRGMATEVKTSRAPAKSDDSED